MQNNFGVYIYIYIQKKLCKCYTKTGLKPGMCPWVFRILQIICCTMSFSAPILAGFQCHHIYFFFSCMGEPHAQASLACQLELDEEDRKPFKRQASLKRGFSRFLTTVVEDADAGLFKGR